MIERRWPSCSQGTTVEGAFVAAGSTPFRKSWRRKRKTSWTKRCCYSRILIFNTRCFDILCFGIQCCDIQSCGIIFFCTLDVFDVRCFDVLNQKSFFPGLSAPYLVFCDFNTSFAARIISICFSEGNRN